tara:strand:- start:728 stop:1246 length:519 start_codon:yes stop_codon:yes gene_type:complete
MKSKIFLTFLIIFFIMIFFIFYKGLQNPNIYVPKNNFEKDIPSFKAKIFDNNASVNSGEIFKNDKFYLLNIWASWCSPCRDEHSFLMELHSQKNLEIIGLNYKDKKKNAYKFLKELDNPYEIIISDKDGTLAIEWGAYGVPESFLIQNQKIIKKIIGPLNKDLFTEIKRLIK